jgi:hypothetical protein
MNLNVHFDDHSTRFDQKESKNIWKRHNNNNLLLYY